MPVVFDCDGVLVDSESLAWRAITDAMERFDVVVTNDDRKNLVGHPFEYEYAYFAERATLPAPEIVRDAISDSMFALFERHLESFEDAKDTLEVLAQRGMVMAVASTSARDRLDVSLRSTGLADFFVASVAGAEVAAVKPAPDLFLRAAELLGVPPDQCTAVEDSPVGIAAAKAAGMLVVAVDRGDFSSEELAGADVLVPRLTPALFHRS